ncbi:hypothetical protein C8J57DRAFT_1680163 [Mycena rebaudengoi]|nr:hypothetical protein C8J57DRAFT_1680163 [Mycena rebaudengoi]
MGWSRMHRALCRHRALAATSARRCGPAWREHSARNEIAGESKFEENEGGRGRTMTHERKWDKSRGGNGGRIETGFMKKRPGALALAESARGKHTVLRASRYGAASAVRRLAARARINAALRKEVDRWVGRAPCRRSQHLPCTKVEGNWNVKPGVAQAPMEVSTIPQPCKASVRLGREDGNQSRRTISSKAPTSPTKPNLPQSSRHKRMFSLNRKGKAKERAEPSADSEYSTARLEWSCLMPCTRYVVVAFLGKHPQRVSAVVANAAPSFGPFRGNGWLTRTARMRARTGQVSFVWQRCPVGYSDPFFSNPDPLKRRREPNAGSSIDREFRVRSNQKTVKLSAPSVPSREEWVKAIRGIFKAQNMGDSVKVYRYPIFHDVEKSTTMDFSETLEVKVFDKEEHFSVDSYFVVYFRDLPAALDKIRDAVRAYRVLPERSSPQMVMDTTVPRQHTHADRAQSMPNVEPPKAASSTFSISFFLRPFHDMISLAALAHPASPRLQNLRVSVMDTESRDSIYLF